MQLMLRSGNGAGLVVIGTMVGQTNRIVIMIRGTQMTRAAAGMSGVGMDVRGMLVLIQIQDGLVDTVGIPGQRTTVPAGMHGVLGMGERAVENEIPQDIGAAIGTGAEMKGVETMTVVQTGVMIGIERKVTETENARGDRFRLARTTSWMAL